MARLAERTLRGLRAAPLLAGPPALDPAPTVALNSAAQPGAPCESVDAAARKVITQAGFGPDYKVPGLPNRTVRREFTKPLSWPVRVTGPLGMLEAT